MDPISAISNFFNQIISSVEGAFEFIVSTITGLVTFVLEIPSILNYVINSLGSLPITILSFALAALTIRVVIFILGRK